MNTLYTEIYRLPVNGEIDVDVNLKDRPWFRRKISDLNNNNVAKRKWSVRDRGSVMTVIRVR